MNRLLRSFRWRLQLWHSLLLALMLAAFWATTVFLDRERSEQRIDDELERYALDLTRRGAPREGGHGGREHAEGARDPFVLPGSATDDGYYVLLWSADGKLLARSPGAPADAAFPAEFARHRTTHLARTIGHRREVVLPAPRGQVVLAGRAIEAELAEVRRRALWLALLGGGVLAVGLAGGWWLATRAIRPIDRIAATAEKIAGGDLTERIDARDFDSEFHPLARVLNTTFTRLEAAFERQVRFTADASHELRTPVSVILMQAQSALARERAPADYRAALAACDRAAQRMRRLVDSLLFLARLDARATPPARLPVDLPGVIRGAMDLLHPLAERRGVIVRAQLAPVSCTGDPDQLGQVVANLLGNALHHTAAGRTVRLELARQGTTNVLTVTDEGEGIAPEDLSHIFERFHRADKARARAEGRTGLGLAISQAIVTAHGGRIEARSEPGRGSVFTVLLPDPAGA